MEGREAELSDLVARRRAALIEGGVRRPLSPLTLKDATLLGPRWRSEGHRSTLHHRDLHVISRAYRRSEMIGHCGGAPVPMRMGPGIVSVIPAGFSITCDIPNTHEYSLVVLPDSRLQGCAEDLDHGGHVELGERLAVEDPIASSILRLISHALADGDFASTLFIERAVDLLCVQLLRKHANLKLRPPHRGLASWQVRRVTAFMRDELDRDVTLQELSALVGLSRFHFCKAFRLATGRTPHEWFILQRIGRARELLRADPKADITDIALAVGYSTPSAFGARFRKIVGVTPREYRRRR